LKLLFVSTPVGPLGSGAGGGVELTLYNMATEMGRRGHTLETIAPQGSGLDGLQIIPIPGELQVSAQNGGRDAPISFPADSVLGNMWNRARQVQENFDVIVNFAYDWLPFYLTPFFDRPVAHIVSMASLSEAMDDIIIKTHRTAPHLLAFHSATQAQSFNLSAPLQILGNGLDLSLYEFSPAADGTLAWVGRIAPEKALEDGIIAAKKVGLPLKVFGQIANLEYWQSLQERYGPIDYRGFLPTLELQRQLKECSALLMTPRWLEAFGNVCIEALACGVPVIAYGRGGPAEIIEDGKTGFLVQPDSIDGLVAALSRLGEIDRSMCRRSVQSHYSLSALGDRLERWLYEINDLKFERS
jgi:UDP-glucose:tetrahydrobiopterin glucosyltransferase